MSGIHSQSCIVRGLQMGEAPLLLKGILERRFAWHEFVADVAVKGDRNLALQALMLMLKDSDNLQHCKGKRARLTGIRFAAENCRIAVFYGIKSCLVAYFYALLSNQLAFFPP